MTGNSLDIREDRLEKLKQVFPELFTENQLDWEKLQATFTDHINFSNERYVLNWAGKADAFKSVQQPTTATLNPVPDESLNFDTTKNIFIEGENLEVLKVLQKSYYGKIKCIIIDPPYNTGNDNFIYPDDFKEHKAGYQKTVGDKDENGFLLKARLFKNSKENGHFHSNWLSMMYPRLFLARNLLKEDGSIFVFIDDNELHNLLILMNSIFGEENFVTTIAWKHTQQSKNDELYFSRHYNSIISYRKSKNLENFRFERTKEDNKNYSNPDNDINGDWRSGDVRSPNYRKALCFNIKTPTGKLIGPPPNGWRWSNEEVQRKIDTGEIIFNADETKIIRKIYLDRQEGRTPENLWDGEQYGTTRTANAEIKELFEDKAIFDTPKPTQVIKKILELATEKEAHDIVLDFFAGSATTAHAVMDKNWIDKGNRNFILVQLPEQIDEGTDAHRAGYKTIADISKERIRKVIKKLHLQNIAVKSKENSELKFGSRLNSENREPIGFKVFKLAPSNFKNWRSSDITADNLIQQLDAFTNPIKENVKPENMLYEILLKAGYTLTEKITSVNNYYSIDNGKLIIALTVMNTVIVAEIITARPEKVITLDLLFSGNDALKTNTTLQMQAADIDFKTI